MSDGIYFHIGERQFRIVGRRRMEMEPGYAEPGEEHYNVLEEFRPRFFGFFPGWVEVEREHIPAFAWIEVATLGGTQWQSKLIERYRHHFQKLSAL